MPRLLSSGIVMIPAGEMLSPADLAAKPVEIDWFCNCGSPMELDLTLPIHTVEWWEAAAEPASMVEWENVEREAQNQLTIRLHAHDNLGSQKWNRIAQSHIDTTLTPLFDIKQINLGCILFHR